MKFDSIMSLGGDFQHLQDFPLNSDTKFVLPQKDLDFVPGRTFLQRKITHHKSVLNTTFELFKSLSQIEIIQENKGEMKYVFYGEIVGFSKVRRDLKEESVLILEELVSINGYRNGFRAFEDLEDLFSQSIQNLIQKINLNCEFNKDIPFIRGIGKFILRSIIIYAKNNDFSKIELKKNSSNEDFYEKVLECFREDNTIQDFEIIGNIVFIYL